MSVKDKYVEVRYHMNTGKARYVVKEFASATKDYLKVKRGFCWFKSIRNKKSKYCLCKDVGAVDYKVKYRMEC